MKISIPKLLKIIIPLGIGIFLIWYSLSDLPVQDREQLLKQILSADPFWLSISVFVTILCHLSRAIRWNYLIEPLGFKSRISVSFPAIMMGYVINLGIPRSGDVFKTVTVSKYENIPFQKAMGTVITERLVDFLMLLVCVALAFFFNTSLLTNYLANQKIEPLKTLSILVGLLFFLILIFQVLKRVELPFLKKIKKFTVELYEGVISVFKMKQKLPFILHSIFIWGGYIFIVYILKYSIPVTSSISFSGMLMAFVAGSFAYSTTNGGIGAYPIAIGLALMLFSVEKTDGEALGWIIWTSQTLINILVGGLCFLYISIFVKKK